MKVDFLETINSLPPEFPKSLLEENRNSFLTGNFSIIVLDDDPTGTQTIFDVPVLTTWSGEAILQELKNQTPLFFILTNSRSLVANDANDLATEIGQNIKKASELSGRKTLVISRGDSTLRGHYPNEVDALAKGLEIENSPQILIPAFFQGGRHTINDVHYVREGDKLLPAAETPFAKDETFGYRSSDLKDYVEEKTEGSKKANEVVSISIKDLRIGGPDKVAEMLDGLKTEQVCVVNAADQSDLDVFASGLYKQRKAQPLLFRTAASIIPSLAGLAVKSPLEYTDLNLEGKGGVLAVGSYVPKTSEQLNFLKKQFQAEYVEIKASDLLGAGFENEVERASAKINKCLEKNEVVIVYTSRELIKGNTPEASLQIVNKISNGMVEVMKGIRIRPGFFIAKGGITSSDIVTKSFSVKKAQVLGQIIPGVPVWQLSDCVQFPDLMYMPFPGNLGGKDAVFNAIKKLVNQ